MRLEIVHEMMVYGSTFGNEFGRNSGSISYYGAGMEGMYVSGWFWAGKMQLTGKDKMSIASSIVHFHPLNYIHYGFVDLMDTLVQRCGIFGGGGGEFQLQLFPEKGVNLHQFTL